MYKEVKIEDERLLPHLDKILKVLNYDKSKCQPELYKENTTREFAESQVSIETLESLLETRLDKSATANLLYFHHFEYNDLDKILGGIALKFINFKKYGMSNRIWYPENGFMGWHTNHEAPGYRLYCTHSREENKSFFRFKLPKTGEVITSYDPKGWSFRFFNIDQNEDFWHCVYSETDRISLGYRFM